MDISLLRDYHALLKMLDFNFLRPPQPFMIPVNPECTWDLLIQMDPYKSMGPDRTHPRILKESADVTIRSLNDF